MKIFTGMMAGLFTVLAMAGVLDANQHRDHLATAGGALLFGMFAGIYWKA